MGESVKAVCSLVLIATVFSWYTDNPGPIAWSIRVGSPIAGALAIGVILKLQFRTDAVPDYLAKETGNYFNRGGFCFAFNAVPINAVCHFVAYFQNQHDQPCVGRIALRPARGFFLRRARIEMITFEVNCEPAAFGFVRIPAPVSRELQGKRQSFEVGASVDYPQGKGQRLRFRDGIFLRTDSRFGNSFGTALTVAGALSAQIVLSKPATVGIDLPTGVAEELPEGLGPELKTLWRLGNPPLEDSG